MFEGLLVQKSEHCDQGRRTSLEYELHHVDGISELINKMGWASHLSPPPTTTPFYQGQGL